MPLCFLEAMYDRGVIRVFNIIEGVYASFKHTSGM